MFTGFSVLISKSGRVSNVSNAPARSDRPSAEGPFTSAKMPKAKPLS